MTRIQMLQKRVDDLYSARNPNRDEWADWLHKNHVFVVSKYTKELSEQLRIQNDLAVAAGMLHDIADAVTRRTDPSHSQKSETIARGFLEDAAFSKDEISLIIDDALKFHGCRDGKVPQTLEGKIMATADARAHLDTNFYHYALKMMLQEERPRDTIKKWGMEKIERDFRVKISFDDVREKVKNDYERVRKLFLDL